VTNLIERDQAVLWHPYTQHQLPPLPLAISRAEGAYLFDEEGKAYLDLISSWWITVHGHAHPKIAEAIYKQALKLDQIIFAGFTHEPAVRLGEKLLQLLPTGFSKVFYSDNGAAAIEVALKMAYQYWRNRAQPERRRILAFAKGYHGDTLGCMSVGQSSMIFEQFKDLCFKVDIAPFPSTWINDQEVEFKERQALEWIEGYFLQHPAEVAALIIEPLVQATAGMRFCRPEFLRALERLAREHQVLVIYDEVMTGFSRTGATFACQKAKTKPDLICLAKSLTGGFLPLSATVCDQEMYQAFLGDDFNSALAHGHTYAGNPLGCAAALATLELLEAPATQLQIQLLEQTHQEMLPLVAALPGVSQIRYCGTIAAFRAIDQAAFGSALSHRWRDSFQAAGLILRPIGDTVYLMPPYCLSQAELVAAYEKMARIIQQLNMDKTSEHCHAFS